MEADVIEKQFKWLLLEEITRAIKGIKLKKVPGPSKLNAEK